MNFLKSIIVFLVFYMLYLLNKISSSKHIIVFCDEKFQNEL